MDLVESDKDEVVEETTTRRATDARPNNQPAGIAWLRTLSMILLAIILVVLIVLFARWVYHKVHHNQTVKAPGISATSTTSTSSTSTNPESGTTNSSANTSTGSSSSNGSQSSKGATSGQSSSSSQTTQNGQLPNNGPGNVMAVFVGASLVAGGAHYVVTTRRAKQI